MRCWLRSQHSGRGHEFSGEVLEKGMYLIDFAKVGTGLAEEFVCSFGGLDEEEV